MDLEFGDTNNVWHYQQNPNHTYGIGGTFTVTEIVTDANGCSDQPNSQYPSLADSLLTQDGENDILYVYGGPYRELEFKIYNNWANAFTSTNQKVGWDGTKDGTPFMAAHA